MRTQGGAHVRSTLRRRMKPSPSIQGLRLPPPPVAKGTREALAVPWGRFAPRAIPDVTRRLPQTRVRWPEAAAKTPLYWRHTRPSPGHKPGPTGRGKNAGSRGPRSRRHASLNESDVGSCGKPHGWEADRACGPCASRSFRRSRARRRDLLSRPAPSSSCRLVRADCEKGFAAVPLPCCDGLAVGGPRK